MLGEGKKRTALVIGNDRYEAEVGRLQNPAHDAKAMGVVLRKLGFSVMEGRNLTRDQLLKTLDQFRKTLPGAEVALLYYAGHGLSVGNANYLVPIRSGFDPDGADHLTLKMLAETRLFNAEQAVADMGTGGAACNIIILDACRTSLLSKTSATRNFPTRTGLVEMTPPAGSLIAFATDSGETALDGEGKNGLYTGELVKHLITPGISIEQVFKRTRAGVVSLTDGAQVPAEYSRLVGDDIFLAGLAPKSIPAPAPAPAPAPRAQALDHNPNIFTRTVLPRSEDLVAAANKGDSEACLNALQVMARVEGPGAYAKAPLEALLENVKTDLAKAEGKADAARAAITCERILKLLPNVLPNDHPEWKTFASKAHNRHGDALFLLGRMEEAIQAFDAAHLIAPDDAFVLYNRGVAYQKIGNLKKAHADFTAASDPNLKQPTARKLAENALTALPKIIPGVDE